MNEALNHNENPYNYQMQILAMVLVFIIAILPRDWSVIVGASMIGLVFINFKWGIRPAVYPVLIMSIAIVVLSVITLMLPDTNVPCTSNGIISNCVQYLVDPSQTKGMYLHLVNMMIPTQGAYIALISVYIYRSKGLFLKTTFKTVIATVLILLLALSKVMDVIPGLV
jgi:hypothetical protein